MAVYVIMFFLLFGAWFYYDFAGYSKYRISVIIIIAICFILFSGLSYMVGSDISAYMSEFSSFNFNNIVDSFSIISTRQPGWVCLQGLCRLIINDFWFFKLVVSIILNCSVFYVFTKYSTHTFTCLLFYFFMLSFDVNFNILRQSLSIAVLLFSYHFFEKEKLVTANFLLLTTVLFHNSAIFLITIPILNLINVKKNVIISIIGLWTAVLVTQVVNLQSITMAFGGLFGGDVEMLSSIYDITNGGHLGFGILFRIVLISIIIFFNDTYTHFSKYTLTFLWLYGFFASLGNNIDIFYRLTFYFLPVFIICIVDFIFSFTLLKIDTKSQILVLLILLIFFLYPGIQSLTVYNPGLGDTNFSQYIPYSSVLFNNDIAF